MTDNQKQRIKKTAERLIDLIVLNAPDDIIRNEIDLLKKLGEENIENN